MIIDRLTLSMIACMRNAAKSKHILENTQYCLHGDGAEGLSKSCKSGGPLAKDISGSGKTSINSSRSSPR